MILNMSNATPCPQPFLCGIPVQSLKEARYVPAAMLYEDKKAFRINLICSLIQHGGFMVASSFLKVFFVMWL